MTQKPNDAIRDLLTEEYRTLRQESLDSLGHRLTVINFTFAALSIVISAMVASDSVSPGLLALLGIGLVPQGAKAGLFVWLGEYQRSQRAGAHLVELEARLNALCDVDTDQGMSWETRLARHFDPGGPGLRMKDPYRATIGFTMGVGWAAEVLGLWYGREWLVGRIDDPAQAAIVAATALAIVAWEVFVLQRFFAELAASRNEL